MRTRWWILAFGVSIVLNVLLGTAFWQATSARGRADAEATAAARGTGEVRMACPAGCQEERRVREELTRLLSAERPDRAAVAAAMTRLDAVRAVERDRQLDRWLRHCEKSAPAEREALQRRLHHALCPWNCSGEGNCAPSTGEKAKSALPQS